MGAKSVYVKHKMDSEDHNMGGQERSRGHHKSIKVK